MKNYFLKPNVVAIKTWWTSKKLKQERGQGTFNVDLYLRILAIKNNEC